MMHTHDDVRCPDEETLAAYVERSLSARESATFERHLSSCADCRDAASALADALDAATVTRASVAGLADRTLAGLAVPTTNRARGPRPILRWLPFVAAAVALPIGVARLPAWSPTFAFRPSEVAAVASRELSVPPIPIGLGGGERFLAHVSIDKPIYRPGETVFGRAIVLNAFDRRPIEDAKVGAPATFVVKSSLGEVLARIPSTVEGGVAPLRWELPEGQAGGTFRLTVEGLRFPDAEATFDVRELRAPRLSTDLQFARKAYGPGERVDASLCVLRADGGLPAGARVDVVATLDGAELARTMTTLDGLGRATTAFVLPARASAGVGTLAMTVTDGGVVETAAKSIPIVWSRPALSMYPEGGDLVAGVPCRVYLEARTSSRRPADVAGRVLDSTGAVVASFETVHEGRGRFTLTPRADETYHVVLDRPAGVVGEFPLPPVHVGGISLATLDDASDEDSPVRVSIASPDSRVVTVGLYRREREMALVPVSVPTGRAVVVTFASRAILTGVLRVTAFDASGTPRAERLILRRARERLKVVLRPEASDSTPGGRSKVEVLSTDADGRPVSAIVGLCVTDDAVLSTVDPRERASRLPVQVLLGSEVAELGDAGSYLGADAESALRADLLLATQGWRRFAHFDPGTFAALHGDVAMRALGVAGSSRHRTDLVPSDQVNDEENPLLGSESEETWSWRFGPGLPAGVALNPTAGAWFNDGRDGDFRGRTENLFERSLGAPLTSFERPNDDFFFGSPANPRGVPFGVHPEPSSVGTANDSGLFYADDANRERRPHGSRITTSRAGGGPGGADPRGWMRVYAHRAPVSRPMGERSDFADTVYWNAGLATDASGHATIEFDAGDALTTLRVRADAFTKDGAVASSDAAIVVRRAFQLEAKLPVEVTTGDRIEMPVALTNGTRGAIAGRVTVDAGQGLRVDGDGTRGATIGALGSSRVIVPLVVGLAAGDVRVHLAGGVAAASDDVARTVRVVPAGFPVARAFGGVLERSATHDVIVSADAIEGSVSTEVEVYPSPMASLTAALAGMLHEPGGCFEQTSSSNYPNVMVLQYLRTHAGADPALVRQAREMLARGYARLVSFECKSGGFEWFGRDPGHEALTAYGLMEFTDMASVMDVDREMVDRTRRWLRGRRDGKGGFLRNATTGCAFGRGAGEAAERVHPLGAPRDRRGRSRRRARPRARARDDERRPVRAGARGECAREGRRSRRRPIDPREARETAGGRRLHARRGDLDHAVRRRVARRRDDVARGPCLAPVDGASAGGRVGDALARFAVQGRPVRLDAGDDPRAEGGARLRRGSPLDRGGGRPRRGGGR